ncbi:MAG: hypothetical protein IPP64_05255 [Bacteroidetes bacterium]|nr:hypothetical protein [Bacteroidota bacterium]
MKKTFAAIFILLISACGNSYKNDINVSEAKSMSEELLVKIQEQNYDVIRQYYSDNFFVEVSEDQWKKNLMMINDNIGEINRFELSNSEITYGSEPFVALTYIVDRGKTPEIHEFSITKENGTLKIFGHKIKL